MNIRKAEMKDIKGIVRLIDQAKAYFKEKGIPQWQGEYPARCDIEADRNKGGYVIIDEEKVVGYCFIAPMQDSNYKVIEQGQWLNDEPYVVMHRTCVSADCKGRDIAGLFVEKAAEVAEAAGIHNVRADTHEKNISMRRFLKKHGFRYCGIVHVADGTPRAAGQLVLK